MVYIFLGIWHNMEEMCPLDTEKAEIPNSSWLNLVEVLLLENCVGKGFIIQKMCPGEPAGPPPLLCYVLAGLSLGLPDHGGGLWLHSAGDKRFNCCVPTNHNSRLPIICSLNCVQGDSLIPQSRTVLLEGRRMFICSFQYLSAEHGCKEDLWRT